MSESAQLDKTFQIIMKRMMETGQAPHFTEIASEWLDFFPATFLQNR